MTLRATVLLTVVLALALGSMPPDARADDAVTCYQAPKVRGLVLSYPTLSITDQFGSAMQEVLRPAAVCPPTDVDGGGIVDPNDALACYATRDAKPRVTYRRRFDIQDVFGTHTLVLGRPYRLCVPSALGGGDAPGGDVQRCYKVRTVGGNPGAVPVEVSNEFATRMYTLKGIVELCTPGDIGDGIQDPTELLACYRLTDVSGLPPFDRFDISIDNQFGPQAQSVRARPLPRLCMPATMGPPPTSTTSTSSTSSTSSTTSSSTTTSSSSSSTSSTVPACTTSCAGGSSTCQSCRDAAAGPGGACESVCYDECGCKDCLAEACGSPCAASCMETPNQ